MLGNSEGTRRTYSFAPVNRHRRVGQGDNYARPTGYQGRVTARNGDIMLCNMYPVSIRLSKAHWQRMIEHVQNCLPEEACGLLGGEAGKVSIVLPMNNVSQSPGRFQIDPQQQIDAFLDFESKKLDLVGIYHSHPAGPSYPSEIDIKEATYPEAAYLIWYRSGGRWTCRAFVMRDEGPEEIPITFSEEGTRGSSECF